MRTARLSFMLIAVFALAVFLSATAARAAEGESHFGCLTVSWRTAAQQQAVAVQILVDGVPVQMMTLAIQVPRLTFEAQSGQGRVKGTLEVVFGAFESQGKLQADILSWSCDGHQMTFAGELGRW